MKIDNMPRYQQTGETTIVSADKQFLAIEIVKIDFLESLARYGDPSVRATIEWGDDVQNSRWIKVPKMNQTFLFQLTVSSKDIKEKKPAELAEIILSELKQKPTITVHVWADLGISERKHVGSCTIHIKDLNREPKPDKKRTFRDKETRKDVVYFARVLQEKRYKIVSAYQGANEGGASIEFNLWFQKELPYPDLDLNFEVQPAQTSKRTYEL